MTNNQPVPFAPPTVPVHRALDPDAPMQTITLPEREEDGGLPVGALFGSWRRRWIQATLLGFLLAAIVTPVVWYFVPVKYTVFTLLRVSSAEPRVLPTDRGGPDPNDLFRQTQVALVMSRPVLLSALRHEKVRNLRVVQDEEDPAAWLERKLVAGFVEGTEILRIAIIGEDPEGLSAVVSAIEHTYLQEAIKSDQNQRHVRLDEIQKITSASEEKMRGQREKLRKLAVSLKTSDTQSLTLRQRLKLEEYSALQKELAGVRSSLRQCKGELVTLEAKKKALPTVKWTDEEINELLEEVDPQVRIAAEDVVRQELVLRDTMDRGTSRMIRPAEEKLKSVKQSLEKVRVERKGLAIEQLKKKALANIRVAIEKATDRLDHLRGQEADLEKEADAKGKEADAIGITSIELDIRRGEIEQAENVIKSLRGEKERLEVEVQSSARRVTSMSPDGEIYKVKNTKNRLAMAGVAGIAAFLLGTMLVTLLEFSHRRVHSSHQVVRDLGLKLLATLPKIHGPESTRRNATGSAPTNESGSEPRQIRPLQNLWAERIAGLRTALLLGGKEGLPPVLMVTSAGAQEGKTTLASHLAVSMASTGRKVLLIDGDLRRPVLHKIFDTAKTPGLCEVLRDEAEVVNVIQPTRVSGLFLLPAGQVDSEALRVLSHNKVRLLLQEFKGDFNFVIIDTSPVLPVVDALLIGQYVDGILLAVRPAVSRLPRVREAYERLKTLNTRFVGAVLNGGYEHMDADDYKYLNRHLAER